jgi:hypothetical protein
LARRQIAIFQGRKVHLVYPETIDGQRTEKVWVVFLERLPDDPPAPADKPTGRHRVLVDGVTYRAGKSLVPNV